MICRFITDEILNDMLDDIGNIKLRTYLREFSYDD